MNKPLSGIRVLDMSRILAGPWCGQHLADLGAEVIKIEHPERGDDTRGWGPPYLGDTNFSAYYLCANRGKKSVGVDISKPEGQELIRQLTKKSDIVLENFKVGTLKRYGLDYNSLKKVKPDIIYCSITGFGQDGPYANRAGYDFLLQGMGGLMSITGNPDDKLGGGPVKVGVAVTDVFTGMYAATSVLSALIKRDRTGEGSFIDLSLLDVQVGILANQASNYLTSGESPGRLGNAHPNIVPYQAFATENGHIILTVGNDSQFRSFCEVAGRVDLADDERFVTNKGRVINRETLVPELEQVIKCKSSEFWLNQLEKVGVPCGPINDMENVFANPQVQHRGMKLTMPHPEAGEVGLVSNPVRIDNEPMNANSVPPGLGEHTISVLEELIPERKGQMNQLREQGVIA